MKNQLEAIIKKELKVSMVKEVEFIQELWSGYGVLARVITDQGAFVVKLIEFPQAKAHPRGWGTDIGHERKVKSYKVEKRWYQKLVAVSGARMARGLAFGEAEEKEYLVLEDLKESGFHTKRGVEWDEVEKCLSWLAHFHKNYLGCAPLDLWQPGTYWHLGTRPEELEALDDKELKAAAPIIDKKLNEARFQTIIHGDAKLANFLFNNHEAAAVDFQYVGGGVGIKDVAYFMSSIYEEDELSNMEERCLKTYFKFLDLPDVEKEWRELYPFAWADFYRFLKGWSPGHWKVNSYSENMKNKVLQCL